MAAAAAGLAAVVVLIELASRGIDAFAGDAVVSNPSGTVNAVAPEVGSPVGAAYDSDASLPARANPIASYTMRASLDATAHVVHGVGTILWTNASRVEQRELWVHLYLNAFKSSESIFLRTPRGGFRGHAPRVPGSIDVTRFAVDDMGDLWPSRSPTTPGDSFDETDIRVPLPRPVAAGASVSIDMAWDAKLPAIALRTGFEGSFHMAGQWFPKIARLEPDGHWAHFPFHPFTEFYADFGAYDVTIDAPRSFVVGATGEKVSSSESGGRTVARYRQADVHDFAFAAWDGFAEARAEEGGVAIRCLFPAGYDAAASAEIEAARFGLRHFGALYGPYPYATLTLVHPPAGADEAGGMEYPTLITTGGPWYLPYTGVHALEVVTIHELGHQWFYGLVATDEHAFPFLDEGINSYAETEAMEAWRPGASLAGALGISIGLPAGHRFASAGMAGRAPVAQAASAFALGSDYGALVYSRTATILTTLARVYGEDLVRRAIGRYARRNRFEHPGPGELLGAIDEVVGHDAAGAASAALFDEGWVDFSVTEVHAGGAAPDAPGGGAAYEGEVVVERAGTLRFPVEIALYAADGSVTRTWWDGRDAAAHVPYRGRSPLVGAEIDPDHRVLLDDRLSNNARSATRVLFPRRLLERATFAAEAALSVLAP